ncbi:MAG: LysR family transcriptional regulator [Hyphomicrobium sp.]|jgi:DNA-binding transcriptional LysR family regulator
MQGINWNDFRYVLAVARTRAIAPAARVLGVNETTVSRRIANAEAHLGSMLFERVDGSMRPTRAGRIVVERAERMEAEVGKLKGAAIDANGVVEGNVRVTSIPLLINHLLLPAVRRLQKHHPHLQLELVAEPRNLSLMQREADIALRSARPEREQRVIARRIGQLGYAAYGPRRQKSEALSWITYDRGMAKLPHVVWLDRAIRKQENGRSALTVNDSEVALHAIRAGAGKSLLPCCIGDASPDLIRLSGPSPVLHRELWLLIHPDAKDLARIRTTVDWIEMVVASAVKS